MWKRSLLGLLLLAVPTFGHHGGTSNSQGPGTPIETNSPLTLPAGGTVLFGRAEIAKFRQFGAFEPDNIDAFSFYSLGASHGLTDYLMATVIAPFNVKTQDNLGTISGFGDAKLFMTLGFNYSDSEGFQLNGEDDTAVNLGETDKTYLGLVGGIHASTGRSDIDLGAGLEPGLQPGFGSPAFTVGLSLTKSLAPSFNFCADTSYDLFTRRGNGDKFGNEFRANLAGVYELFADQDAFVKRMDGILELNYLQIQRDETAGVPDVATGGKILYLTPGFRFQLEDVNLGMAVKIPIASALNERDLQQGSEGLERYRLILTASTFF